MTIGVLEHYQSLSDQPKHFVSGTKARRLVSKLCVAVRLAKDRIKLTVAHSWSIVKLWLKGIDPEREARSAKMLENERIQAAQRLKNKRDNPEGAQFGFSRWPSPDLRSL
jgi:hypothetical protein